MLGKFSMQLGESHDKLLQKLWLEQDVVTTCSHMENNPCGSDLKGPSSLLLMCAYTPQETPLIEGKLPFCL